VNRKEQQVDTKAYWAANLRLTIALLGIWFIVSYGAGILFRGFLDQFSIGGAPLGFWFAQQGSIYVFVVLIFYYCAAMKRLERKYRIGQDDQHHG
jgi:putative solute:sodium symporter small subunit